MSVGYGVEISLQIEQLQAEQVRVKKEVARVKKVSNFLADLFTQPMLELTQGKEISARALIDPGADRPRKRT